jgi:nucleoside-diphosphate-sugar epimerase
VIGITGSTGVLGRILVGALDARGSAYSTFNGDIRQSEAVEAWLGECRPEAVFHLAARVPVDSVAEDPVGAFEVNAGGTLNLVRALAQQDGGAWLFYAGTSHVYRGAPEPMGEDAPTDPHTIYGRSKLVGEQIVDYFGRYAGIRTCIGRIFSMYHSTQQPPSLYPSIQSRLKNHVPGEPFVVRNGFDVRDFMNAEQVVDLLLKLYSKGATGIVNIGSGKGVKIVDFVRNLAADDIEIVPDQQSDPTILIADVTRLRELTDGC